MDDRQLSRYIKKHGREDALSMILFKATEEGYCTTPQEYIISRRTFKVIFCILGIDQTLQLHTRRIQRSIRHLRKAIQRWLTIARSS